MAGIFIALAVDGTLSGLISRLLTAAALVVLAWLQLSFASGYVIVAAVLVAPWIATWVFRWLK